MTASRKEPICFSIGFLVYSAFGWLTFAGTMHFLSDVLLQYLRRKRVPGPETTLYYGLNTA